MKFLDRKNTIEYERDTTKPYIVAKRNSDTRGKWHAVYYCATPEDATRKALDTIDFQHANYPRNAAGEVAIFDNSPRWKNRKPRILCDLDRDPSPRKESK